MDSAFFSDEIVMALEDARIEFTVSVPFERFVELKGKIEGRKRWRRLASEVSYFEGLWKPKVWNRRFRFLLVRTRARRQQKGPVQLDLFLPYEYGYDFKVVVTNKTLSPKKVLAWSAWVLDPDARQAVMTVLDGISFGAFRFHPHVTGVVARSTAVSQESRGPAMPAQASSDLRLCRGGIGKGTARTEESRASDAGSGYPAVCSPLYPEP